MLIFVNTTFIYNIETLVKKVTVLLISINSYTLVFIYQFQIDELTKETEKMELDRNICRRDYELFRKSMSKVRVIFIVKYISLMYTVKMYTMVDYHQLEIRFYL